MRDGSGLRLAMACAWNTVDRERTWSGVPWSLYQALQRDPMTSVTDTPIRLPRSQASLLRYAFVRWQHGRLVSTAEWSTPWARLHHAALRRALTSLEPVDAVLTIGEHGPIAYPQFVYQDQSVQMLADPVTYAIAKKAIPDLPSYAVILRRADHERRTYASLAGVFSMSAWNAHAIRGTHAIEEDRIHVVGAGINADVVVRTHDDVDRLSGSATRTIVFVGRHFFRKGGDLVVNAARLLRQKHGIDARLVIIGPRHLPPEIKIEPWMTMLGDRPTSAVRDALREAHVLALPSRFEAYGIAILEALASGVPVVGRCAFAMPEMIRPGVNGAMINDDSVEELADALGSVVSDTILAHRTVDAALAVRTEHSWTAVAERMTSIIRMRVA